MKKLLFLLFLLLASGSALQAQQKQSIAPASNVNDQEIRKVTDDLVAKYSLNADQAKQMYTIQVRKAKNMAEIAGYQQSDPALYRAKVQNVQKGTVASVRRILNTKAQVELHQKTQSDLRAQRNKKQKELISKKAAKADIELALLAIYAE